MEIVTADWETYYDKDYSLSKMSTEEYVRDPRFQAIMLDLRWPDGTHELVTGSHAEIQRRLGEVDWSKYAILAHNCMFDAAIFAWRFGVRPAAWLDTLSMARAMFGGKGNSLASLAKRFNLPDKGTEVLNAMGKHLEDFTPSEFAAYADYCRHDVDLCHDLFELLSQGWYDLPSMDKRDPFPVKELELIDKIIRMFTEPTLRLNKTKLEEHLKDVVDAKEALLAKVTADKDTLMSNPKFAELLASLGVEPPQKISPTTNKWTFAFAKTDPGMKALLDHPKPEVQALVAARMGVKSTLEETRTQRFIDMAARSELFPVPLRYSAARTHRLGGMDGINMQNLPARGEQAGKLKSCIEAPPGHVIIDCDSSNIEARMLAWLAGQDDLVADFANGVDVYCKMASRIFGREITKADTQERFVGKTVVLGCGYQTGKIKLQATLKAAKPPMDLHIDECERIIEIYRDANHKIRDLWERGEFALQSMHGDKAIWFGRPNVVLIEGTKGVKLPNGLYIHYPQLHRGTNDMTGRPQWMYKDTEGLTNIYGGKLTENVVQALARIVVMYQLLKISKRYKVVLTVHDAVAIVAPKEEADEARAYIEQCMRWVPKWAEGCPINCESGTGDNYGAC